MSGNERLIRSTCPRDCYDSCGMTIRIDAEGQVRITGDGDDPVSQGRLCGKCALVYNRSVLTRDGRLTTPLLRAGAKGEGLFRPSSWPEVLDLVAGRLGAIAEASGGSRILNTHYCGTRGLLARDFPMRFLNRLGTREVRPETICYSAGAAALEYIYGTATAAPDLRDLDQADCVVLWGVNAASSAPHGRRWLRQRKGALIVVDPLRHKVAAEADLHLQPRPGSDALLAFGLMRAMMEMDLLDEEAIAGTTVGFDDLHARIAGISLEEVARATEVPVADLRRFAELYAPGPSLIWVGMGLQRRVGGGNAVRAVAALPALTGNLMRPGSGLLYVNGMATRGLDADYLTAPHLRPAPDDPVAHPDLVEVLADPEQAAALVCWNNNIVASSPRQEALKQALRREDLFTVCVELYHTDTVDYADVVLPAADFTEFDDLVYSYLFPTLGPQRGFRPPPGEALPNQEIFRRLSRAMGFSEPELFEDDRAVMAGVLARSGYPGGLDDFLEGGNLHWPQQPHRPFADGRFPTPSGKVELTSARAVANGYPATPEPAVEVAADPDGFWLLSPGHPLLSNSSFGQFAEIRRRLGPAEIAVNPADAERLDLADGQEVEVIGSAGSLRLVLRRSGEVRPGVALSHKNRWPKLEPGGRALNAVIGALRADYGDCFAPHSERVRIAKP